MTKIDIISGFLGSGKTTLIKKLLKEKLLKEKIVIIENEFGEIGIDGSLLKKSGIEIKELNSGCICCTLVGDFERSIREIIHKFKPERIIIEPSGVGKLSEVLKACETPELKDILHINMLITVVDVSKYEIYLPNFGEFFENQIKYARTIILSRTQKASHEKIDKVVSSIRKLNDKANIVTTPLESLKAEQIVAVSEQDTAVSLEKQIKNVVLDKRLHSDCCECGHVHKEIHHHANCRCGHEHHHSADEIFEVWGMETSKIFNEEELKSIITMLDNDDFGFVLRGKGFLQVDNGAWVQFDYVPEEINMSKVDPDYTGRICIIGRNLNKNGLKKLFHATV
ncbi:GTP-binding protein [Clostridium sp. D2Q-14]|uniref:CobW family GTP-binding protein n=1 Tax=Anaeromonas gelatinilytica TaxID=2683194 RepID=UPI00193B9B9E|nr:GTP-binding protein [Anaeromonas gelatinilytica]MBS4535252.1 GTP-binding protein [Anaeromonas gelatinilytica]